MTVRLLPGLFISDDDDDNHDKKVGNITATELWLPIILTHQNVMYLISICRDYRCLIVSTKTQ